MREKEKEGRKKKEREKEKEKKGEKKKKRGVEGRFRENRKRGEGGCKMQGVGTEEARGKP